MVQGKVWFMIGEENGVEDKAGEMRAKPREPQQGSPPYRIVGTRKPPNHREIQGCLPPSPNHLLCDLSLSPLGFKDCRVFMDLVKPSCQVRDPSHHQ